MIFPSCRMQVGVFFFPSRSARLKGKSHVDIDRVRQFQQDQHYPQVFNPLLTQCAIPLRPTIDKRAPFA